MSTLSPLEAAVIHAARLVALNPAHQPRQAALRRALYALDAAHLAPTPTPPPRERRPRAGTPAPRTA